MQNQNFFKPPTVSDESREKKKRKKKGKHKKKGELRSKKKGALIGEESERGSKRDGRMLIHKGL